LNELVYFLFFLFGSRLCASSSSSLKEKLIVSCAHLGLGGKVGHESSSSVAGVVLLDERDGGVDDQKHDDTNEVLPVRRLATTVGERNSHDGSHLHDPRERVPHEAQELEKFALLRNTKNRQNFTSLYIWIQSKGNARIRKGTRPFTCFSSSLLGPKTWRRCVPSSEDSPSRVHFSCSNTSSMGMFSCKHKRQDKQSNSNPCELQRRVSARYVRRGSWNVPKKSRKDSGRTGGDVRDHGQ
jgi:hypothetical protein